MGGPKREAFLRLAEKRTNGVLDRIRVLGNLSNSNAYDYRDEDVRQIFSAIDRELRITKGRFETQKRRKFQLGRDGDAPAKEATIG